MRSFTEDGRQRIVFGAGTLARLPDEVARLGGRAALVLTTPEQAGLGARVAELLGPRAAGTFAGATMHTPLAVTEKALAVAAERAADVVVAVGGGSTTGLGKAVAVRTGLTHLVVPTTYAGSEVTPVLGETGPDAAGRPEKLTRSDPAILPQAVLYDVELTRELPWAMTVTSAVNALAHAVEALYSVDRGPESDERAVEAIVALAGGLRALAAAEQADDRDAVLEARGELLYGAWQAGICLGTVGMGLHHKLCHTLGGSFGLPHAATHTVVLPYAMEYNAPAAPAALDATATALGAPDAPSAVQRLVVELRGPTDLRGLGFALDDVDRAAELATARPYPNPRPVTRDGVADLLTRATLGTPIGARP